MMVAGALPLLRVVQYVGVSILRPSITAAKPHTMVLMLERSRSARGMSSWQAAGTLHLSSIQPAIVDDNRIWQLAP
jgi:hypothetical protein